MTQKRSFDFTKVYHLALPTILIAAAGGWGWNIHKIIQTCCQVIDGMLIVRVIGVLVAPLGAVIGFF